MQVVTRKVAVNGQGKHRRRVTRTVVLYQATSQGTANRRGQFTGKLRITYTSAKPVAALKKRFPDRSGDIDKALPRAGQPAEKVLYLPLKIDHLKKIRRGKDRDPIMRSDTDLLGRDRVEFLQDDFA